MRRRHRELSDRTIARLATEAGPQGRDVRRRLRRIDPEATLADELRELALDARIEDWTPETLRAIRRGLIQALAK